jgi:hypothetical protein
MVTAELHMLVEVFPNILVTKMAQMSYNTVQDSM